MFVMFVVRRMFIAKIKINENVLEPTVSSPTVNLSVNSWILRIFLDSRTSMIIEFHTTKKKHELTMAPGNHRTNDQKKTYERTFVDSTAYGTLNSTNRCLFAKIQQKHYEGIDSFGHL